MIDPEVGEALAEFENRLSFLEKLHAPSNNPSNLEERVAELEKQRPPQPVPIKRIEETNVAIFDVRKLIKTHLQWHKEKTQPKGKY